MKTYLTRNRKEQQTKETPKAFYDLRHPCANCRHPYGNHRQGACPEGRRTRIGFLRYSLTSFFVPLEGWVPPTNTKI